MTIPHKITELVERFRQNQQAYMQASYNETQVRREFIDPFFTALGWDVANEQGYAEDYKDVVHEDAIKVQGTTKAPDYAFRIGGTRKFFVEAKKPAIKLKYDGQPAYQLRRYAWSAKLPLSILTDFEEFAVYDCRKRPHPTDKASVGRILYLTFEQYAERFDEISMFSKEAVLKGSFDRFAKETKGKRGTSTVDAEFLKEIEGWRVLLARNIALRNATLSVHELNFAVQHTIDRLIFLRMGEDRGLEVYGRLRVLRDAPHIYSGLLDLYRQADEKYNSGLFDFKADTLSTSLVIDDQVLKKILTHLYYPESPYEFSVLPADVLGQVYEQFLGQVIRLTPGHRAKVEAKPEVKKAGGVYYTPTYIVNYIVEQTVGKLIAGQTPRQIAGTSGRPPLRILDPACGSGSFLLGAYQYLLDYHRHWYTAHTPEDYARGTQPALYQGPRGAWRLTTAKKKSLLLNHIYGVDIDRQAVEVTKLSLLLKVLEGATDTRLQTSFLHARALPNLGDNIKCGNSLIGPEYFDAQLLPDAEEMRRVNPFDWESEFPEVLQAGGFDGVIGNPPWVSAWTGNEDIRTYLADEYPQLSGHWDLYLAFLVKTLELVKTSGRHTFVYPTSILTEPYAKHVRKAFIDNEIVSSLSVFGTERVFAKVSRKVCILTLMPSVKQQEIEIVKWEGGQIVETTLVEPLSWASYHNYIFNVEVSKHDFAIMQKIESQSIKVGNIFYVNYGAQISSKVKGVFSQDKLLNKISVGNAQRCLKGNSVKRYRIEWKGLYLDYQPEIMYGPRHSRFFESSKIIFNKTSSKGYGLMVTFDDSGYYCDQRLICLVRYDYLDGTKLKLKFKGFDKLSSDASDLYFTGLLASRLLTYWFKSFVATKNLQGEYTDVLPKMVRALPIRPVNFDDPTDVARHDKMVALVNRMLTLHQQLAAASIPADKKLYQRQVAATDRQIDALVYELYGLSADEIGIVEGVE